MADALTDHTRLLAACNKWEQLYNDKCEECDRLTTMNEGLHAELKNRHDTIGELLGYLKLLGQPARGIPEEPDADA